MRPLSLFTLWPCVAVTVCGCGRIAFDELSDGGGSGSESQDGNVATAEVRQLATGTMFTCALASSQVWCWGIADVLGDGSSANRPQPGPTTDFGIVTTVAASTEGGDVGGGSASACAIDSTRRVYCWGRNGEGELGDGTRTTRDQPVATSITDAVELDLGWAHTCARRASGAVACWGAGASGQLGDGLATRRTTPADVPGINDAVSISAGYEHTCVAHATGAVSCWGGNSQGQLGDGSLNRTTTPQQVPGISNAVEVVAAESHTCARLMTGAVSCWGENIDGRLGIGSNIDSSVPMPVTGLTDAVRVFGGHDNVCVLRATRQVACWGKNNDGEVGDGTTMERRTPTLVVGGAADFVEVSVGFHYACARRESGQIVCWGWNVEGQLGDGTMITRHTPTPVVGLP